jgi:hypothetical protein
MAEAMVTSRDINDPHVKTILERAAELDIDSRRASVEALLQGKANGPARDLCLESLQEALLPQTTGNVELAISYYRATLIKLGITESTLDVFITMQRAKRSSFSQSAIA